VTVLLTIGEFSRMTHLSVKALRHYHDVGLLEPAAIDPATGYRSYAVRQVPIAQAIRRFRDLDMPIDQVKAVLDADDTVARNQAISAHLQRMERELQETQATVASLRILLEGGGAAGVVERRFVAPTRSLAIKDSVSFVESEAWLTDAFEELYHAVEAAGITPVSASAGLYAPEFFEAGVGDVIAFVPVDADIEATGRVATVEIPAAELAVVMHEGALTDLDQSYGRLGAYVAEHGIGADGPLREYYLVSAAETPDPTQYRTEVGWPTTPRRGA
jgi:DNA-binding transcriptional MerR regulator